MTIDQILIKTEGIKKDTKVFYKGSMSFISALHSEVKALTMLSVAVNGTSINLEDALAEHLSKEDYDNYLYTKKSLVIASRLDLNDKDQLIAFNLAYFLKIAANLANEGLTLGITHIIRTIESIDRVKVNELVKKYKEEQLDQTTSQTLQLAFTKCGNLLDTKQGAEEAFAALYVLYFYVIKIITDVKENFSNGIEEMLDETLQQAVEAFNSLN